MTVNRIEKVNSLLEQEISKIMLKDFYFDNAMVTLTHVVTSGNLIDAKVYISVLPDEKLDNIVKILNKGAYAIQYKINRLLNMRPIPKIRFVKDETVSKASKVDELLTKLKKD